MGGVVQESYPFSSGPSSHHPVDLFHTILELDSIAEYAWTQLHGVFKYNRHSSAVSLEKEFSITIMADFFGVLDYCQHLKLIVNQFQGFGSPVLNYHLVMKLVVGLPEAYNVVVTLLWHNNDLPEFYQAQSMLISEEDAYGTNGSHHMSSWGSRKKTKIRTLVMVVD
ncbi:uncharacterized protein LOC124909542 [Impatiens glandulifera]|uniref:uncharacterized protein LOC124909542 n=1 Tax=Impatiens glandulifera TaxID=253017 RepID=UPI001FB158A2|nr:uncharacterized protein LOC124909542 [Impatiens glandulifera]